MSRRRASHTSTSSEQSTGSEPSDNLNLSEELPDAGLPKTRGKGGKKKKNVSLSMKGGGSNEINIDLTETGTTASTSQVGVSTASSKGKKNARNTKNAFEVKQIKQIDEKDVKAAANEVNKMYKVADCVKSMNIEMHPALFAAWYTGEVPALAAAAGASVLPAHDVCDPCALVYTRHVSRRLTAGDGPVRLTPRKVQCDRSLYIMTASEAARAVRSHTLTDHMRRKRELIGGKVTLVILDSNQYFQKASKRCNKAVNDAVNDIELEMAITDLLVGLKMETMVVHTATELAQLVVQHARAIAEEPFKRSKREIDEQAEFYMRGDNKNCVAVDKDGNGLSRLWQQMIAILPMSSLEVSRSLTAQYATPRALANELSTLGGESLVADVCVSRAAAATARPRRLGPELANKLHMLLTSDDGNQLIE